MNQFSVPIRDDDVNGKAYITFTEPNGRIYDILIDQTGSPYTCKPAGRSIEVEAF